MFKTAALATILSAAVAAPGFAAGNKCNILSVVANGIFTHGSIVCNQQWLDRPASLAVVELGRLCRGLGEKKLTKLVRRGMDDFDKKQKELGAVAACKMLDDEMKKIEE